LEKKPRTRIEFWTDRKYYKNVVKNTTEIGMKWGNEKENKREYIRVRKVFSGKFRRYANWKFTDYFQSIPYIELNKFTNVNLYSNNVTYSSRWGNNYYNNYGHRNLANNYYGNNYYSNNKWGNNNNWSGYTWGNNNWNNYNVNDYIFFNPYCLKNDLTKISENKLCFTTTSNKNDTLYIVLINIVEMENCSNKILFNKYF
jgi:hypothetical protein